MTEQTLKPCPFCGSDDVIFEGIPGCVSVVCEICECVKVGYDNHEQAIQAWNQRADGWISVDERLPEHNTSVLVYRPRMHQKIHLTQWWQGDEKKYMNVTHWQPLPAPPGGCDDNI
jgi:Lar family restriction alleviation protein